MCILMHMRTNIEIDDDVLREAQKVVGTKTKRETVDYALREIVARQKRLDFLKLRGTIAWEGNLDEMRAGREWSS